jgi:acetyltransferase-like isoleucine patch superfamily enzyme
MTVKAFCRSALRHAWHPLHRAYAVRDNVTLGRDVHIGLGSILDSHHGLVVGDSVYIGKRCTIEVDGSIGDHVLIANNVGLIGRYDHDHTAVGVPIRSAPWIGDPSYVGPGLCSKLIIESDVWVGYGAILLSGIRVGRGAVVAAGSVVTRDVEPYAIVAGKPARTVGSRFDGAEIVRHEAALYPNPGSDKAA